MNLIQKNKSNRIFHLFLSTLLFFYSNINAQNIQPAWQKHELTSYCLSYEVMDFVSKGVWVAFWSIPKHIAKISLEKDSLTYIETDSSLIFNQDIISKHEMIFDKNNRFYKAISQHDCNIDFGVRYSQKFQNRFSYVHDDNSLKTSKYGDGVEYRWESKDCNGHGRVITTMSNEILYGSDYKIIITSTIQK